MVAGTVPRMDPTDRIPAPDHPADPAPTLLRARTPDDIAAFVPLALGFLPERSVVMVSIGRGSGMHARVDLPQDPDDVDDVVEALLRPARRHGVDEVIVVVYDDDTTVADEAAWAIHEEFTAAGIGVREVLRVHDDHWYAVLPGAPLAAYQGVRFTLAEHRFTAQGVFDGRVTHASREALRSTIAPDPAAARAVEPDLAAARPLPSGAVTALTRRHVEQGTTFSGPELASVALSLVSGDRRDEAWVWLTRGEARRAVDLWSDAVRRLPAAHVAAPGGRPGLRRVARRRRRPGVVRRRPVPARSSPTHSLGGLVAQLLDAATSPDVLGGPAPRAGRHGGPGGLRRRPPSCSMPCPSGWFPRGARVTRVPSWVKRSTSRSSAGLTGRGTARRCGATSTCSPGCCARRASTPTTR